MFYEIITGTDDDIDSEILDWAEAGDGWVNSGCWDHHSVLDDVLDYCPSIKVDRETYDCAMLSGTAYLLTTENPAQARKEIRDQLAYMIREQRKEDQARWRKLANMHPRNRHDIPMDEVRAITLEVCESAGGKSAIDGFKAWDSVKVNLFHGNRDDVWPSGAESIAVMTMDHHWDEVEDSIYYHRTDSTDELWVSGGYRSRKAVSARRHGAQKRAVIRLLAILIRAGAGWVWPSNMTGGFRVSSEALFTILHTIQECLDKQREATRRDGSGSQIVKTAGDLGLHPEPSREGRPGWQARCPGRNHFIDIDAGSEYWFCGYCGEKGGASGVERSGGGSAMINSCPQQNPRHHQDPIPPPVGPGPGIDHPPQPEQVLDVLVLDLGAQFHLDRQDFSVRVFQVAG